MTIQEHLLTCLIEECGEIIQATTKSLRFGLYDGYPGTDRINIQDIYFELMDLIAVLEALHDNNKEIDLFPYYEMKHSDDLYIIKKKEKILKYIEYAKTKGTIVE